MNELCAEVGDGAGEWRRIVGVFDAFTSPPWSGVGGGSVRGRIWNNVDQPLGIDAKSRRNWFLFGYGFN